MSKTKNRYENPEIYVIEFSINDIITTSDGNDIDIDQGENDGEWL